MIGLVHPGSMGAAVAHCLVANGHPVAWASDGRSTSTRSRAEAAGLTDVGSVAHIRAQCDIVLSICPPHGALDIARSFEGYDGLFIDANGISPESTLEVGSIVASGGAHFVDGGIIGPAPTRAGTTRLYLAGTHAHTVADLFAGSILDARVLPSASIGAASSLKMAYSAWTKITSALQLSIRASARSAGVEDALLDEWAISQPGLADRSARSASVGLERGWRWSYEMLEIARTFEADGLPVGFGEAAAAVYAR
ncbi:MAG: NAD(P)-dependent oxidoreductase, partial [Pseudonocardiales bacterium]|nr:NAD(P)-dependent oxidoreductase [Pseudonocardiales bacterium]